MGRAPSGSPDRSFDETRSGIDFGLEQRGMDTD